MRVLACERDFKGLVLLREYIDGRAFELTIEIGVMQAPFAIERYLQAIQWERLYD